MVQSCLGQFSSWLSLLFGCFMIHATTYFVNQLVDCYKSFLWVVQSDALRINVSALCQAFSSCVIKSSLGGLLAVDGRTGVELWATNIELVSELISSQEDKPHSHKSPREIQREMGISRSSIRRIVKKYLALNQYKRTAGQQMNNDCKANICSAVSNFFGASQLNAVSIVCGLPTKKHLPFRHH